MSLTVTGSRMDGNTSQTRGGGIYAKQGALTLAASQVFRNEATGGSGGQGGGGLILIGVTATITDTAFARNSAAQFGGALFVYQGSVVTVDRASISPSAPSCVPARSRTTGSTAAACSPSTCSRRPWRRSSGRRRCSSAPGPIAPAHLRVTGR